MKVIAHTTKLMSPGDSVEELITETFESIPENSVITIVSKAFSFAENRLVPIVTGTREEKHKLGKQEADYYLEASVSQYNLLLTIKGNWMFFTAGIDESNSAGAYTLWPKNPQASVNRVWNFIRSHYGVKNVGVIMTDSKSFPLNWGVVGHGIVYCGFNPLKDYRGTKDLFGREMVMERLSIVQSLATAGCLEMGEGDERRPLALITDIQQDMQWQDHEPTQDELAALDISLDDDVFGPFLQAVEWKKGGGLKQ